MGFSDYEDFDKREGVKIPGFETADQPLNVNFRVQDPSVEMTKAAFKGDPAFTVPNFSYCDYGSLDDK